MASSKGRAGRPHRVRRAPLLRVPLNDLQHAYRTGDSHPDQTAAPQNSVATRSPAPGEAATVLTSPSPVLLERFEPRPAFVILARLGPTAPTPAAGFI